MARKEKEKIKTVERCIYRRANGKYRVVISGGRSKRLNVGTFDTLEEAAKARKEAEDKYFKPVIEAFNEQAMYKVEVKDDQNDN